MFYDLALKNNYKPAENYWSTGNYNASDVFYSLWDNMNSMFGDASYSDDEGNTVYEIEVPGFNKDNIEVSQLNGVITVNGKRETKNKSHAGVVEISKRLALNSSSTEVDAEVRDGILYLTLKNPKSTKEVINVK
jgi:HSP20 family molecular chaperone IbpA